MTPWSAGPSHGARWRRGEGTRFRVWAPTPRRIELRLLGPSERLVPLEPRGEGFYETLVADAVPGTRYVYRLDGARDRPDPASLSQPDGVHGPSELVDLDFPRSDDGFRGPALDEYVFYELHVGTFSAEGTFDGVVAHLDELAELGVTAIEPMPIASFPGDRNWGYDGVAPYAVHAGYGGPAGFARLVDEAHRRGLAVVLDVVYNHLGPEGNYLGEFGPYFTDRYRTPWGPALNFDGPDSDPVRRYFIDNALYWIDTHRVDALRLDALHAIVDASARTFVEELATEVHRRAERLGRRVLLVAESAANDPRLVRPVALGGYGLDAHWNDDFHHSLRVLLTGERRGYYEDYDGLEDLARALAEGFVLSGRFSAFRRRRHGRSSRDVPPWRWVVFSQNHDQVGNRPRGERLGALVGPERLRFAAALVTLTPCLPLLFMGEEYGETAPFPYFVSHTEPALVEAVRRGRRAELAEAGWPDEPLDPQAPATFAAARLRHEAKTREPHRSLLALYRELLAVRRRMLAAEPASEDAWDVRVELGARLLLARWRRRGLALLLLAHASDEPGSWRGRVPPGRWRKRVDTAEAAWGGSGSSWPAALDETGTAALAMPPWSVAVYLDEGPPLPRP